MIRVEQFLAMALGALLGSTAFAQVTERVSVNSQGEPANADPNWMRAMSSSMSGDGRYITFSSYATNLCNDSNPSYEDVFLRDVEGGVTTLIDISLSGHVGNGYQTNPSISADGRFVAFQSTSKDLVTDDIRGYWQIFVRDWQNGTTEWISSPLQSGVENENCYEASISGDGRFVTFESTATDLVAGGTNAHNHIFLRDRQAGVTTVVSLGVGGVDIDGDCGWSVISADGRFVTFNSDATNLVPGGGSSQHDIYVWDRIGGTTELVSVDPSGAPSNGDAQVSTISADGGFVAFWSSATNLVAGDVNQCQDVFLRDRQTGTTELVSVDSSGNQQNAEGPYPTKIGISGDGRYLSFTSMATNLYPGGTGGSSVYLRDRASGTTERASVNSSGAPPNEPSYFSCVSDDGRYVAFESMATNFVYTPHTHFIDMWRRDRMPSSGSNPMNSICSPGIGTVVGCPCGNSAIGPDRGCDNSAGTGGATLTARGNASMYADGLVFTTSGELPSALSILIQGTVPVTSGVVYGQGVRCVAGSLKRLFVKSAQNGSIVAPDFSIGDPVVSQRSSSLGDVMWPGRTRWYLVYYRDPVVLGGCPASSTFNATQTGEILWHF